NVDQLVSREGGKGQRQRVELVDEADVARRRSGADIVAVEAPGQMIHDDTVTTHRAGDRQGDLGGNRRQRLDVALDRLRRAPEVGTVEQREVRDGELVDIGDGKAHIRAAQS